VCNVYVQDSYVTFDVTSCRPEAAVGPDIGAYVYRLNDG